MTPPLPASFPAGYIAQTEHFYTANQMTEYGKACAAAEQDRILRIVHEAANAYGKAGECMRISIRAKVRNVEPKPDWSAA